MVNRIDVKIGSAKSSGIRHRAAFRKKPEQIALLRFSMSRGALEG